MGDCGDGDIDEGTLNDLIDLGGLPLLEKLIGIFLDQSPARILQAKEAANSGDFDGVLRAVHSLGSAAGALGALKFQELCTVLEVGCRARDQDTIHRMVPELEPTFALLSAALMAAPARRSSKAPDSI